jgi:hypothetical protein
MDLDDSPERVALTDPTFSIFPSRSHSLGHAIKLEKNWLQWVMRAPLLNHVRYFQNQVIKFLRPTEHVLKFLDEHHLRPLISADIIYFKKEKFVILPITDEQRAFFADLLVIAQNLNVATKTARMLLQILSLKWEKCQKTS